MTPPTVRVGDKIIGGDHVFIVAELSANHGGSFAKALELVRAAHRLGADAVKLQTYRPDTMTLDVDKEDFRLPETSPWRASGSLYDLYRETATPWEWHGPLFEEAARLGLIAFSSVFDGAAVDFLEGLQAPMYKIASLEITDIPLLKRVARAGKPVCVSTGAAGLADIDLAVRTLRMGGSTEVVLLKCVATYPAPPETMNLATIPNMAATFDCHVGISDHTLGIGVAVAAVALGAEVVEKHLILSRSEDTPDGFFSLDEEDFGRLVTEVRRIEPALGRVSYEPEGAGRASFWARRSLYVSRRIEKGELFSPDNIRSVRPGYGLHPKYYDTVIGRRAKHALEPGDRLSWSAIE